MWSSPLELKKSILNDLSLHEQCAVQLGWEIAGKDSSRDREDLSIDELIELGEIEAENRDLVVWLHGYMDPYEGKIDLSKFSIEQVKQILFKD